MITTRPIPAPLLVPLLALALAACSSSKSKSAAASDAALEAGSDQPALAECMATMANVNKSLVQYDMAQYPPEETITRALAGANVAGHFAIRDFARYPVVKTDPAPAALVACDGAPAAASSVRPTHDHHKTTVVLFADGSVRGYSIAELKKQKVVGEADTLLTGEKSPLPELRCLKPAN
jgi:hypothetical protein